MEMDYGTQLGISILIFAPGLVVLAGALFVGLLMLMEKAGVFDVLLRRKAETEPEGEKAPGGAAREKATAKAS